MIINGLELAALPSCCDECRFFDSMDFEGREFEGLCRRDRPVVGHDNGTWPIVFNDDFCGQGIKRDLPVEKHIPQDAFQFPNPPSG